MIAVNHYLAGVGAAVALGNPLVALPMAFASHFVLDALPHFGLKYSKGRGRILIAVAVVDALLFAVAAWLTVRNCSNWYVLPGLVAFSPDLAWIYRFVVKERFGQLPPGPMNAFNAWHKSVQTLESPFGAIVEVGLLMLLFGLLA